MKKHLSTTIIAKLKNVLLLGMVLSCVLLNTVQAKEEYARLDNVVISATRIERFQNDAPVRTEVITAADMRKIHARSLKDALENVPGVQLREIHGKSGFEVILQGMNSDQVLVLIDGLPLAASTGSTVDLSQYSLADVERIEVIKGAASAQYGSSAMGGVINIITRSMDSGLKGSVTYDAGSYGQQNIDGRSSSIAQHHANAILEGGTKQLQGRISADIRDNQGFDANPESWVRQGDDSKRLQYAGRLAWRPNDQFFLTGEAQRFEEDDIQWLPVEIAGLYPNKFENIRRDRYSLASGYRWQNGFNLTTKLLSETYDSDSFKQNKGYVPYDLRSMELQTDYLNLQLDFPLWGDHQFLIGADIRNEKLSQFKDGVAEIGDKGNADRQNYEIFAQNDYFVSDRSELVFGVRVQEDSDFGTYTSPKIAFKYRLYDGGDQEVLFRSSVGTGYRVPNLKERYYTFDHSSLGYMVIGNPDLDPESSISYQAGFWFKLGAMRTLDINAFYNDVRDLIQTDDQNANVINGISIYTYKNINNAKIYGLETVYTDRLFSRLSFNAAHTYTQTKNTDTDQMLTRRPEHIVRLGLDFNLTDAWSFTTLARYQSEELAASSTNSWSPQWTAFDLKTNYKMNPNISLFGGIDNLTNRQRNFDSGTDFGPIAGRFIYFGMEIKTNIF